MIIKLTCTGCGSTTLTNPSGARQGAPCPKCGRIIRLAPVIAPKSSDYGKLGRVVAYIALGAVGCVAVATSAYFSFFSARQPSMAPGPNNIAPPSAPAIPGGIGNPSDHTAIQSALPKIAVGVHVVLKDGREGDWVLATGTGFVVTADGFILTNGHVVLDVYRGSRVRDTLEWFGRYLAAENPAESGKPATDEAIGQWVGSVRKNLDSVIPKVWLLFAGRQIEAEMRFVSEEPDLAVLKCSQHFENFFRLASSHATKATGSNVWPLGYPAAASAPLSGIERLQKELQESSARKASDNFRPDELECTTTKGVFSRLRNRASANGGPEVVLIEHDGKIGHGSSGGPLLDDNGRVIGINTLKTIGADEEGYSFSLSIPHLREVLRAQVAGATWE